MVDPRKPPGLNARQIADLQAAGMKTPFERRLILTSRMAPGYDLTPDGKKHLQHVFTVWFPRAVYQDLTDDTVRVDVVVTRGGMGGRTTYAASFLRADGSEAKRVQYDEDRLTGAQCPGYDQARSGYCGFKDGADYRLLVYGPGGR
jgi:hypothetical protein